MPKRKRMVNCPQCHRPVPEDKLEEHLQQHKTKTPTQSKESRGSKPEKPKCKKRPPKSVQKSFEKYYKKSFSDDQRLKLFQASQEAAKVRSTISKEQIRSTFESALKEVEAHYGSLKVKTLRKSREYFITGADEQRNITLSYTPRIVATLTKEAIEACLLLEACRVGVLPHNVHDLTGVEDAQFKPYVELYLTNYDGYLALYEFVDRFRQDPRYQAYKQFQKFVLENYYEGHVLLYQRKIDFYQEKGFELDQLEVLVQISEIIGDSMFFHVVKDNSFANWYKNQGLSDLHTFTNWIHQDFEHVRTLNLPYREAQNKVINSCKLSLQVDPYKLLSPGKIEFAENTENLYREMMQTGKDTDLIELWEKRHLPY